MRFMECRSNYVYTVMWISSLYRTKIRNCKKEDLQGKYSFPDKEWSRVSPEAKDLVQKLLTLDPAERFSADDALQHPWIANINISQGGILGDNVMDNMRQWNAKRRLKASMLVTLATVIVAGGIKHLEHQEHAERIEGEGHPAEEEVDEENKPTVGSPALTAAVAHFTHNKKDTEAATPVEPEKPKVVEPEKPKVVEPEKPKVVEPEKPIEVNTDPAHKDSSTSKVGDKSPTGSMQEIDITGKGDKKKSGIKKFFCC